MAQKSIGGGMKLAGKIKARRNELGLTIEEAAHKAGVGIKTWCRYEAGESIRQDKSRGVCRALNWKLLPIENGESDLLKVENYRTHEAWSSYLEEEFGETAAASFAVGSDILLDYIKEDLEALSSRPKGTHIGELDASWLASILPPQFLMEYTYEFLYLMKTSLIHLRILARAGKDMRARNTLEEILYLLIVDESEFLIESDSTLRTEKDWKEWVFDLLEDEDVITYLYSNDYLSQDHEYHFSHWLDEICYADEDI